jgi:hypothetical protein
MQSEMRSQLSITEREGARLEQEASFLRKSEGELATTLVELGRQADRIERAALGARLVASGLVIVVLLVSCALILYSVGVRP